MKKYLSIFRIRFIHGLQYRAAAYAGIVTQFAWGGMSVLMYRAFYQSNPSAFPMTFSQLSTYVWLQQAFLALFAQWIWDNEAISSITSGNIAYELARPMDLYTLWFVRNMALRASRAVLRCMPIILVAAFLPFPYSILPPENITSFALFLFTGLLSFLTVIAFCMIVYVATFYTMSPVGLRMVTLAITEFLTGAAVPLPFLPDKIRMIIEWTPFPYMQNLPLLIYSGYTTGTDLHKGMVSQIIWLVLLVLIGKTLMGKALKRVVIQGG